MEKDKRVYSACLLQIKKGPKREMNGGTYSSFTDFVFRVRECNFSLSFRQIRPSEIFGARRKAVLRGEAYTWTPVLGVFNKLREVGGSPYLGFTLCLRAMLMFRLVEALNGNLIGPNTWDRSVRNYSTHFGQSVNGYGLFGCNV